MFSLCKEKTKKLFINHTIAITQVMFCVFRRADDHAVFIFMSYAVMIMSYIILQIVKLGLILQMVLLVII